ncbi:hypothetical protein G9A89_019970 [Geosiphon pyriformis]|nr:hypothetical protein G9A89_019970 [Geosiphon pyriformis]
MIAKKYKKTNNKKYSILFSIITYNILKLFFDYEATVGPIIAIIKKTIKVSGSECDFKAVESKKRKRGVLAEGIDNKGVAAEALGACSWSSETGDTIEFESIDMEEECLVKETRVDYDESGVFAERDPNQMPKSLHVKTKKVLGKPLSVIDYGTVNTDDDVLDDFFLLPPPLPIKLTFSQEKLSFIRKIFSSVNGFGGASTLSKFAGIIRATFTLEKTMIAARKLANNCGVVVNTDLKCPVNNCMNWAIIVKKIPMGTSMKAVCTAMSKFGLMGLWQKAIIELKDQNQADLLTSKWSILIGKDAVCVARANVDKQMWNSRNEFRALLYTLPVGTNAYDLWNFVGLVGEKTCVIDYNPVSYVHACCATVCFGSKSDLISAMAATPVIKRIGLYWSCLSLALWSVCGLPGHISLNCVSVKVGSILRDRKTPLSAQNQIRLANIYAWKSASISRPLVFSGKTWASVVGALLVHSSHGAGLILGSNKVGKPFPPVASDLEKHSVNIENSLISFAKQISELVKRLDSLMPAVPQPSPGYQLPVTPLLQNQEKNMVMEVSSGDATGDETAAVLSSTASPEIVKLENMLEGLSTLVISLSACLDGLALADGAPSLSLP